MLDLFSISHELVAGVFVILCVVGGVAAWIRVGRWLGAFLFVLAAVAGGYTKGFDAATAHSQEKALKEQIAARDQRIALLERQAATAADDAQRAANRAAEAETFSQLRNEEVAKYEKLLAETPAACVATDDDVVGLRGGPAPGVGRPIAPTPPRRPAEPRAARKEAPHP